MSVVAAPTQTDPIALAHQLWPDIQFYDKQVEIIYSVWHDAIETILQ